VVDEFGLRDFINRQNVSAYENGERSGGRQPVGQCARRSKVSLSRLVRIVSAETFQ